MARLTSKEIEFLLENKEKFNERAFIFFLFSEDGEERDIKVFDTSDTFILKRGMILNYDGPDVETTVGRFVFNEALLASTFGAVIPYQNQRINLKKLGNMIAQAGLDHKASVKQIKVYIDKAYSLLHMGKLFIPPTTEMSYKVHPNVIKRRDELLEQHKDELTDPVVIAKIEDELIELDKKYLKEDPAFEFSDAIGTKAFNIHRKKMFISVGGIEKFGESGYVFLKHSLDEGWDLTDFAEVANEIRKGSFNRGAETAKGGELTKVIMRVFETVRITADDCGTLDGIKITFTKDNINEFLGRNIVVGKSIKELTEDNKASFIGRTAKVRSPMYCKTSDGICYACMSKNFKILESTYIGLLAIQVSSTMLLYSMKNMHGTAISLIDAFDEKYFM